MQRWIVLCLLLGVLVFGCLACRESSTRLQPRETSAPAITKQPVAFASCEVSRNQSHLKDLGELRHTLRFH